ncbi:MAG: hypothetical protein JWR06_1990, partial [Jatrophihabitans sp.]|nr:hypothetical protein [Jatrophihabitans sp.]
MQCWPPDPRAVGSTWVVPGDTPAAPKGYWGCPLVHRSDDNRLDVPIGGLARRLAG